MKNNRALLVTSGLICSSAAGILTKYSSATPMVTGFWRLFIASMFLFLIFGSPLKQIRKNTKRNLLRILTSGLIVSVGVFLWNSSVEKTSVANATVFFSLNPIFACLIEYIVLKTKLSKVELVCFIIATLGVGVIGFQDFSASGGHLEGDIYALVCAMFFSIDFALSKASLKSIDGQHFMSSVFLAASLFTFLGCLLSGQDIRQMPGSSWMSVLGLAVVPSILGHFFLKLSLDKIRASTISLLTLTEPIFASVGAYLIWNQGVNDSTLSGFVIITISAVILVVEKNGILITSLRSRLITTRVRH